MPTADFSRWPKVDEVARPIAARLRDRVQLLGDLVIGAHHPHRLGRFETDLGEELHEAVGELELRLVRVTDLVVAKFELHGAPRSASIVELHIEGLHDARRWNAGRSRCSPLDQPAGESSPTDSQGVLEVAAEPSQRLHVGSVEILGEPSAAAVAKRHRAAALDGSLGKQLADHREPYRRVAEWRVPRCP